jgi:hypothetical protein
MRNVIVSFVILASAALAACGGAQAQAPTAAGTPAASAPAPQGGPSANGAATFGDDNFTGPMKPIAATTMADDLKSLGLDPNALPALDQLPPDKLRRVMKTFTKALGARCGDCHMEGDFAAATPRKAIAAGMWKHFVQEVSTSAGGPVYCDSCHQGRLTPLLDRHDKKALSGWMETNFEKGLNLRNGKKNSCENCHGEPFQSHFLKQWAVETPASAAAPPATK